MDYSWYSLEISLLLLAAGLLFVADVKAYPTNDQQRKLLESFPIVGPRDEWLASVRTTFRSLTKISEWAAEGYAKVSSGDSSINLVT